jgi:uncharacterized protein (DUF433 family)
MFPGATRVPVQIVIDFLECGETIDQFLALYPSITRRQVLAVLDLANTRMRRPQCATYM